MHALSVKPLPQATTGQGGPGPGVFLPIVVFTEAEPPETVSSVSIELFLLSPPGSPSELLEEDNPGF